MSQNLPWFNISIFLPTNSWERICQFTALTVIFPGMEFLWRGFLTLYLHQPHIKCCRWNISCHVFSSWWHKCEKRMPTSEGDINQCSLLSCVVWTQMHVLLCVHLTFLSIQNCKWGNINCSCFTLFSERVMLLGQSFLFKRCVVDTIALINYLWKILTT